MCVPLYNNVKPILKCIFIQEVFISIFNSDSVVKNNQNQKAGKVSQPFLKTVNLGALSIWEPSTRTAGIATEIHRKHLIQGIIALKRLDVKMSRGNVIPSLNGSQLYSSHPKQKCTKIYPEETAPGPRPLPYMGKILTFDRKVVETPFFYQNDRI